MSYRPEGWEDILQKAVNDRPYSAARGIPISNWALETGADAMLEALKKEGQHTDGLAPTLSINVLPEQKGYLVFIPEEGIDG